MTPAVVATGLVKEFICCASTHLGRGRWAFARAERSMRVRGTLGQY